MGKTGGLWRSPVGTVRLAIACSTLVAAAAQAEPAVAGEETFVVDAGVVQCPDAEFTSIQAAVDAAPAGSRVLVCPGRYSESVTVTRRITLEARGKGRAARCLEDPAADPLDVEVDAVLTGGNPALFLQADDVVVDGFVVDGNVTGLAAAASVSGYLIRRTLFQHNSSGVILGASGVRTSVVQHSCFRVNDRFASGPFGPIPGSAIVNLAGPQRAVIEHSSFFRNPFGIRLGGGRDVTVAHNTSVEDGTWLRMGGTRNLTVSHNHIGAGAHEGMLFFPQGGQASGAPNSGAVIAHNTIEGRGRDGIRAQAGTSSLTESVLSSNRILGNGRDGIRIETGGNTGNRIEHNRLLGNGEHDCHDNTATASGAGNANQWVKNQALTENVEGLCGRHG